MEPGADGRLGLKRGSGWGAREYGADGTMGKAGVEGSMGQKGVWGAWHTPTHHPPLAPSSYDISQPAGRHLPYFPGGPQFGKVSFTETENRLIETQRTASHRRDAGHPAENDRHLSAS